MDLYSIILKLFRLFYCTFSLTEENLCLVTATPLIIRIITILLNTVLSFLLNITIMHISFCFTRGTSTNYTGSLGASETSNSLSQCKCENHNLGPPSWRFMLIYI